MFSVDLEFQIQPQTIAANPRTEGNRKFSALFSNFSLTLSRERFRQRGALEIPTLTVMAESTLSTGCDDIPITVTSSSDPRIPPSDGTCAFFTLPQELRDQVYEIVLTEPHGLFSDQWDSSKLRVSPKALTIANQLKNVCRQLHTETKGLGLRYNIVSFCGDYETDEDAVRHFRDFVNVYCSQENRNILRAVIEEPRSRSPGSVAFNSYESWAELIHSVLDFCRAHPKAQITYRTSRIDPGRGYCHSPEWLVRGGVIISDSLRGTDMGRHLRWGLMYTTLVAEVRNGKHVGLINLPNLRFFPKKRFFEEKAFRRCANGLLLMNPLSDYVEGGIDKWVEVVKTWYDQGI